MRNAFAVACFDFLSERTAVTVGIEDANDTWNTRLDGPTPRITGSSHRTHCRAVVGAVSRDDFFAARYEFGHFHGVLVRFGTAQREKGLGQTGHVGEFFAEETAWLRGEAGAGKAEFVHLHLDGFEHLGVLVADIYVDEL